MNIASGPASVREYRAHGHEVLVEAGAGTGLGIGRGAEIAQMRATVLDTRDMAAAYLITQSPQSRRERRDGRWHREAFRRIRLWFVGYRGPDCGAVRRVHGAFIQDIFRAIHAVRGSRLASGVRALGTRLCNGGSPIGAGSRIWDPGAFRGRILHIGDQPSFASRHGTAWNAARSCR
jgi:hypothetical protein